MRANPTEDLISESTMSLNNSFQALLEVAYLSPERKKVKRMTLQTENP